MVCVCSLQTRSQIFYNKAKCPTYILQESVLYGKQGFLELTKFIYLFILRNWLEGKFFDYISATGLNSF